MRVMTDPDGTSTVRDRLKAALVDAMKRRDREMSGVLRATLGAIDNAQAVDTAEHQLEIDPDSEIAGAVRGLGGAEVQRRALTEAQVAEIVREEVTELRMAARVYAEAGQLEHSAQLSDQADALRLIVDGDS